MARHALARVLVACAISGCGDGSSPSGPADDDSSSGDAESSTGDAPIEVAAEVITYPAQPMVVDLILTPSIAATALVSHADDPGVRIAELDDGDDATLAFRVRGLAPDSDHALQYQVVPTIVGPAGGTGVVGDVPFTTEAALPGFLAAFQLETSDTPAEPIYRMFDYAGFPTGPTTGFYAIDVSGITRFYLGIDNELAGPTMVWAAVKLLDDGTLVYLRNETLYHVTELGETLLEIPAADLGLPSLHHEIMVLPNGNYLALSLAFEDHTYPTLGPQHVAGDVIVEFTREGEVVWTWDAFDHMDPQRLRETPEALPIIDPATGEESLDWTHANGLIYEEADDTVIISLRHQDWIMRIDRATGDILWRLGYEGDFTLADGDRWFYHPHSPEWQEDGSLVLYDNGIVTVETPPPGVRSRAVRFEVDETAMTADLVWEDDEEPFFAPIAGDADRMPSGHLLVLDSSIVSNINPDNPLEFDIHSVLREVDETASPTRVWSIITPTNQFAYRATANARLPGMPLP
jgi:hypothetical protein